ncbi:MAG: FHA domain-containing protein, partial [Vicinamibacterales bacterium]
HLWVILPFLKSCIVKPICRVALLLALVGTLCAATVPPADGAQAPSSAPAGGGRVDDLTAGLIRDLKTQAFDAEKLAQSKSGADKKAPLIKARDLYEKIVRQDPDDVLARTRFKELSDQINALDTIVTDGEIRKRTDEALARQLSIRLGQGQQALIDAKRSRSADALARAQAELDAARNLTDGQQLTTAQQDGISRLDQGIAGERSAQRARTIELWGGIGVITVVVLGGLVFYAWRRGSTLEMLDGPEPGRVFTLEKGLVSIGMGNEVDWVIPDPMRRLSRHHCDVVKERRRYFVVDRSTNGTLLNGRTLRPGEPALLRRGDQIGLGGAVTLRFH